MIGSVSKRIASRIKSIVPEHPRSEQVLAYSISFLLNTVSVILLTLLVSLFTGRIVETVIVMFSFALLRQVSGGYHFGSAWLCIVMSTAVLTAMTFANFGYPIIIILTTISLLLALRFAPSRIEKQTRIPKKYYPMLKVLSLLIISTSFIFDSPVLTTAFFVQSMTLIRYSKGENE